MAKIRILVIDDHPILREGVAALIGTQSDMEVICEAGTGRDGLEAFREHAPDITLVDLSLPDMNGIDIIQDARKHTPEARIVVLTTFGGDAQVLRALKAGASGYLLKATLRHELIECIQKVHTGSRHIPGEIAQELAQHAGAAQLTEREIDVVRLIASGCSNKIVADRLFISEETVKGHVRNILTKLKANDRTHAVTIALKRGIIQI
jgi:DNA-binding NarL/FixJ family response regulator